MKPDNAWDGLKGYATNARLSQKEVIEQYGQLMANRKGPSAYQKPI
ncbi:MAG: hypothetical protein PHI03_10640 [Bacteroidales bacterium]|nr:hypothetical protein [Bacteroidales bacterium]